MNYLAKLKDIITDLQKGGWISSNRLLSLKHLTYLNKFLETFCISSIIFWSRTLA